MRNVILAMTAILATHSSASAQPVEWANKLFSKSGESHNFGSVARGAVLKHRFPLVNIYAVPLQIISTRVSCGCATVTPSASVIQPKEKGYIEVTMDARRFTGHKDVSIYITVGPRFVSTATLKVSANCRADVVFNPGEINFGVVSAGQTPTKSIDIEYAGALDWRVSEVAAHKEPLVARLEELYRRPGQVGYRMHVSLKQDASAGNHKLQLLARTNDPASPLLPIQVGFTIQAPLSVVPKKVQLSAVAVGKEQTQRVIVRGNKPFRILSVQGVGSGLSVDFNGAAGQVQVVTIKWQPTQSGPFNRSLEFKTDLNGGATATVSVEGKTNP